MEDDFKIVEFECKFKMEVKVNKNMSKEEIINRICDNFQFVIEYGSSDCDCTDEYSACMSIEDIQNISIED